MSKLSAEIKACGLCNHCGSQEVTAISEKEAMAIIAVCKAEFIKAIEKKYKYMLPTDNAVHISSINTGIDMAIKAIKSVR